MVVEFFAFLILLVLLVKTAFLESIWNKIELLKNICTFIGECPKWLNYHKLLDENVKTLGSKMVTLCCVEQDVNRKLENAEFKPRNTPKREVENWLENVQSKKSDVQSLLQNVTAMKLLMRAWWGSRVEKSIQQLDELINQGSFPEGVVIESSKIRGEELLTTTLVGTQETTLARIWACVMNDEILRIGVLGPEGSGKTSIISHINNRLINDSDKFNHVYWVTVSPDYSIFELQNDIAGVMGLDFSGEKDERKRAAWLHKGFIKRGKTLLILDGLSKHFYPDKVGVSTQVNGCKLILTTQSWDVCRKMGCREIINMKSLPLDEAVNLFMEKLGLNDRFAPHIEETAKLIVEECDGLPLTIINMAEMLRGVDQIYEWRNALEQLREFKNGLRD